VIVGAGFGGLNAARLLGGKGVDVTIIDRNNYHGFWPLLYQVATAGTEADSIAYPVRAIFRKHRNVNFEMAQVDRVDLEARRVITNTGRQIPYDYLVLAAGSANNYFGNDALATQTYGLKDIDDAERLRNRLLLAFEQAVSERDPERRRALLTFVLVGGGPTGVEMAGALSELINHVLKKDYPALDLSETRVILLEGTDHLLAAFPESLQEKAKKKLESMGVEVRLNALVSTVENGTVTLKDGSQIKAGTVVWAAGVRSATLSDTLGAEQGRNARVKVEPTLNLSGHKEVFVVGDMAYLEGYKGSQAYPMVAQVAIQMGKRAARNILLQVDKQTMKPFRYFDEGTMATIGRSSAVFDAFGIRLSGFLAWLGWLFIHIIYLIGFRNRLIVLTNWAINYFTYERGVRLITGRDWPE
jgi:NADH dehydrogenase